MAIASSGWAVAAAEEPTTRKSVELDAAVLERCVGRYQLESEQVLSISRFRAQLYAKTSGRPVYPIFPESETTFVYRVAEARITFERDANGKVTGARYDHGTIHSGGPKISDDPYEAAEVPEILDSPRLAALAKELDGAGGADATRVLGRFWESARDHAPLVEPFEGDAHSSWVTFLFRGDAKTRTVSLTGGAWAASGDGRAMNLTRLRETDLWYRSVRMPNDARFLYDFEVNLSGRLPDALDAQRKLYYANSRADALNPNFVNATGSMSAPYSVLELPEAPPQPYRRPVAGTPAGKVEDCEIESAVLHQKRRYALYTPPGYRDQDGAKGPACPLVVMFDGGMYHDPEFIPGPTILDNLIAAKQVPPVVVAFVDQRDRGAELNCSETFAAFVANELVPRVRTQRPHVISDARHTTIGGVSLGGLMASYCALTHSEVFGNVISQSGAYQVYPGYFDTPKPLSRDGGSLTRRFVDAPKLPVRFYLEAGRFEDDIPDSLLAENRRLRDVLRAKGNDVTYSEFSGGHNYICWRGSFADALIAVTR